ncbi:hypothetical protein LTR09_010275 [Extremus antarcticus]|uniref:Uncharacterized protein n=1 Tax=Extremus antarcticus TaxID=702011 RepID=A0AAJ0G8L1_9PEZI|nr:hypothetical protein LTR09_010275 [Extremus antarcticus]
MESAVPSEVRTLGISNIDDRKALRDFYDSATIKPAIVQNRPSSTSAYDRELRSFCSDKGIVYQARNAISQKSPLMKSALVARLAERANVHHRVALYGLVIGLGNVSVLDATRSEGRMREDVEGTGWVRDWARTNAAEWKAIMEDFGALLRTEPPGTFDVEA